ncbi:MAG TPA: tetratricopeptide repeat protein [Rhizomicrobium sp.]|jgi:predicted O-linked N-acetylglucosamine transferase (SPINDLY family)|nr:tetratricopeptide repeat protein [Rhizomicrobium sp.]
MDPRALLSQAIAFHQTGRLADAERLYRQLMAVNPGEAAAPHMLGVVRAQQGRNSEALELMGTALALKPEAPEILSNYGNVLKAQGRFQEALASYDKALSIKPDYPATWNKRALVLRDLGRLAEALESAGKALSIQANPIEALNTYGIVLADLGRPQEALAHYDRALTLAPAFPDALNNRALTLRNLKQLEDALASVEQALTSQGDFAEAWNNRGVILFDLKRMGEALQSYDQALVLRPGYADAYNNRAAALFGLRRFPESLADCDRALALQGRFADALYNRGNALSELNRPQEALSSYEQALAIDPDHPNALSGLANAAMTIGDWTRTAHLAEQLKADVLENKSHIQPFVLMGYVDDNELQLRCSQNYVRQSGPGALAPWWQGEAYGHDKIRLAYLSADFHEHVTAGLLAEMFERHDRERFEITAVSFGPDDASAMRARLIQAFDRFHDARQQSDRDVAALLRAWEIDIAIDLGSYTSGARPWVLAHRPAPVQAKYMGYPGTSGSDFIDYLIADRMAVPEDQQRFFSEKIIALPDTLWVTDTRRTLTQAPSRGEVGLPEQGFVFCCFNHNWKITPPVFDIWMRLLGKVEGSTLWLLEGNATIRGNLCREAEARGIDESRLVFAGRTSSEKHLARHQLADLFLDTLPYNAHTTASDALWAGLPVITTPGRSFPARVAASILKAAGLSELIARDLEQYEALALTLARNPAALAVIRKKLLASKDSMALFDTARFTRNLEAAFVTMLGGQAGRAYG